MGRVGALGAVAEASRAAGDELLFFTSSGAAASARPTVGARVWVQRPGDKHDGKEGEIIKDDHDEKPHPLSS